MGAPNTSKMILFYSPQGGCGKTTLAINSAYFSALWGSRTLLVDMSMYGSIMSALRIPRKGGNGLSSVITWLDLDANSANNSTFNEVVKGSVVPSGINERFDVLIGANPVKMEAMNEKYTKIIIDLVRNLGYQTIVIDSSTELSERNLVILEEADTVIIPVIQDVSCGWKMVMFREVMERYSLNGNKFRIIVNMCSKYSGFNNGEFESEIQYQVIAEIPFFLKKYQCYLNDGVQINAMPNRKAVKSFYEAAQNILTSDVSPANQSILRGLS